MVSWDLLYDLSIRSDLYTDVDIKIEACGICGSDVHTISGREITESLAQSQLTYIS
jgi:Threonine dehydrogenase and related Zn-dependent dehydrogenases